MKTFRIKEEYIITQWSYFKAVDEDAVIEIIESGDDPYKDEEIDVEHKNTDWKSLEEVG